MKDNYFANKFQSRKCPSVMHGDDGHLCNDNNHKAHLFNKKKINLFIYTQETSELGKFYYARKRQRNKY